MPGSLCLFPGGPSACLSLLKTRSKTGKEYSSRLILEFRDLRNADVIWSSCLEMGKGMQKQCPCDAAGVVQIRTPLC